MRYYFPPVQGGFGWGICSSNPRISSNPRHKSKQVSATAPSATSPFYRPQHQSNQSASEMPTTENMGFIQKLALGFLGEMTTVEGRNRLARRDYWRDIAIGLILISHVKMNGERLFVLLPADNFPPMQSTRRSAFSRSGPGATALAARQRMVCRAQTAKASRAVVSSKALRTAPCPIGLSTGRA